MRFKSVNIFRIIRLRFGLSNSYIKTKKLKIISQIKQHANILRKYNYFFSRYSHQFLIPKLDEKASSLNHENISLRMTAIDFVSSTMFYCVMYEILSLFSLVDFVTATTTQIYIKSILWPVFWFYYFAITSLRNSTYWTIQNKIFNHNL